MQTSIDDILIFYNFLKETILKIKNYNLQKMSKGSVSMAGAGSFVY